MAEPRWAGFVFGDVRFAWVWLIARVWLGWEWLQAGWGKLGEPEWMESGEALRAFWTRAVAIPEVGRPAVAYDWYRAFLSALLEGQHEVWFAKVVVWGEILVGVALLVGALTGLAAFLAVFMNWHFVMAGAASTNAMLAFVGVLLILGWRTAGWWGLDRWILAGLGLSRVPAPPRKAPAGQRETDNNDRSSRSPQ